MTAPFAPFADIKLTWAGREYSIPARKTLGAIDQIENVVTLEELSRDFTQRQTVRLGRPRIVEHVLGPALDRATFRSPRCWGTHSMKLISLVALALAVLLSACSAPSGMGSYSDEVARVRALLPPGMSCQDQGHSTVCSNEADEFEVIINNMNPVIVSAGLGTNESGRAYRDFLRVMNAYGFTEADVQDCWNLNFTDYRVQRAGFEIRCVGIRTGSISANMRSSPT